jgi:hypothetical protein
LSWAPIGAAPPSQIDGALGNGVQHAEKTTCLHGIINTLDHEWVIVSQGNKVFYVSHYFLTGRKEKSVTIKMGSDRNFLFLPTFFSKKKQLTARFFSTKHS